jgi:hypothetical protein
MKSSQVQEREDKLTQRFSEAFGDHFSCDGEHFKLFELEAPRPNRLIFTEDWGPVEECICHGDLNANNILVNTSGHRMAFIDFQSTGFHNIFRDFVSLESSVRIDWSGDVLDHEMREQFEREILAVEGDLTGLTGYLAEVCKIRHAALSNFPIIPGGNRRAQYLIASFIHFSWLATRFDDWTGAGYRRLLLGAYANLLALAKLQPS